MAAKPLLLRMTELATPIKVINNGIKATHILTIGGETFPIHHLDRRLYKFLDWKDAREKLIKIMTEKIVALKGVKSAYIEFQMANPMRKSRLGNFFIDIKADILYRNEPLGTLEELGLKQIFATSFVALDESESLIRSTIEVKHSIEQYTNELTLRVSSLKDLPMSEDNLSEDHLKAIAESMMVKEGWSKSKDNRIHARKKRVELFTIAN